MAKRNKQDAENRRKRNQDKQWRSANHVKGGKK